MKACVLRGAWCVGNERKSLTMWSYPHPYADHAQTSSIFRLADGVWRLASGFRS
jgi:hypothetical protein